MTKTLVFGNPPKQRKRNMAKKRKSRKINFGKIAFFAGGMGVSELAGSQAEKMASPLYAEKILGAQNLNDKGKVALYRGAQGSVKAVAGIGATWLTCKIAKSMKVKDESLKSVKMGGYGAAIIGAFRSIFQVSKAFGENAQTSTKLLADEKIRLDIKPSGTASTGAYLTTNRTGAYLTTDRRSTGSYLTTQSAGKTYRIM